MIQKKRFPANEAYHRSCSVGKIMAEKELDEIFELISDATKKGLYSVSYTSENGQLSLHAKNALIEMGYVVTPHSHDFEISWDNAYKEEKHDK